MKCSFCNKRVKQIYITYFVYIVPSIKNVMLGASCEELECRNGIRLFSTLDKCSCFITKNKKEALERFELYKKAKLLE